jgi:hypothetical protein
MIYIILLILVLAGVSIYLWKFYKKPPKQKVLQQKDSDLGDKIIRLKDSISELETGLLEYAGLLDKLAIRLNQDESAWLQKQEPEKGPVEFPYASESKGNGHQPAESLLKSVIQGPEEIRGGYAVTTADPSKSEQTGLGQSDQEPVAKIREELSPELKAAWAQKMVEARKAKKLQKDKDAAAEGSTNGA